MTGDEIKALLEVRPEDCQGLDRQVTKPGSDQASARRDAQGDCIDRAREILGNGGGEIVFHRSDGRIGDADTVASGHDPSPQRDRK